MFFFLVFFFLCRKLEIKVIFLFFFFSPTKKLRKIFPKLIQETTLGASDFLVGLEDLRKRLSDHLVLCFSASKFKMRCSNGHAPRFVKEARRLRSKS
jgi:hypothetical protein